MTTADSGRRVLLLALVFALLGCALVVRLGYWQVSQRDRLVASAREQIYSQSEEPSRRGDIYDRSGTILLAGTVTRERLIASGQQLDPGQRGELVQLLMPILALDPDAAVALQAKLDTERPYLVLATDLTPSTAETIRSAVDLAGIPGITFETTYTRDYQPGGAPGVSLAAQLLGFVNASGTGQYGVEQRYQDVLAGTPRVVEADKDATGQPIVATERTISPGAPGEDLRLTLDASLQLAAEQEVLAAQIADRADSVSVVVMDPYSGEVYADASYPSYDANSYAATADADASRFLDPVVSQVYEPGSVFKMLTTIAALETGTSSLQSVYRDPGHLVLDNGQARIQDFDGRNLGNITLLDAIAKSRNVVAAQVAFKLGSSLQASSKILHDVWTRFGFGAPTGIDVAGEVGGLVNDPTISAWRQIDLANGSFGQGVAVTPIQLAAAYAAMVNGGVLVQPHVVASIGGQAVAVRARGQIMDASLTSMLEQVMTHVVSIDAYRADVQGTGFWVGGKTGTAQIWSPSQQRYLLYQQNFSFVGFAGRTVGHPDLIIAVKIGGARPRIGTGGALILALKPTELFRRIVTDAMTTPGLLPPLPTATDPAVAGLGG
ncbi:MAG TPA: penicillin-binding protein 2 [Candidatus Limnocylindrales bacterium]|nr:penicillin-binding protein 2 [Candidatus Limnocylindrales bacterium]